MLAQAWEPFAVRLANATNVADELAAFAKSAEDKAKLGIKDESYN